MKSKVFYHLLLPLKKLKQNNIVLFTTNKPRSASRNSNLSNSKPFEKHHPSRDQLLRSLNLDSQKYSGQDANSQKTFQQESQPANNRTILVAEKELLLQQLASIVQHLQKQASKMDKILIDIHLTSAELLQQFNRSMDIINKLCQNIETSENNQIRQKKQFFEALRIYLSKHSQAQVKSKLFANTYKAVFYVEACCKSRDMLKFFESYGCPDSIINSDPNQYSKVWEKIEFVKLPNEKEEGAIDKQYDQFRTILYWLGGAVMLTGSYSTIFVEQIHFIKNLIRVGFNFNFGLLKNMEMHYRSRLDKIIKKINIMEEGMFKDLLQATCPQIASNFMIYVPFDSEKDESSNIYEKNEASIPVRILHHEKIDKFVGEQKQIDTVIIHVHGGGYVALSSTGTQYSTRSWANQTKLPIFSIDYRLAPEHPFPRPIEDCFRVYEFIINHIHKYFNINPKNIYVIGDSAGGSISCGLITMILQKGMKVPQGQFLIYPNLDLRKVYYGSRKYLLEEPLLWPSLIKLALEHYLPSKHDFQCQLASPLLLTEQFIGGAVGDKRFPLNWPKTYIHVGARDTLRDECLMFTQRMVESGIDCKCFVVDKLRHAYLGSEMMTPSAKGIVNHASKMLVELINSSKKAD